MELTESYIAEIFRRSKKNLLAGVPNDLHGKIHARTYVWLAESHGTAWMEVVRGLSGKLLDTRKRARIQELAIDIDLKYLCERWIAQEGRCLRTNTIMQFDSGTLQHRNPYGCSIDRLDNSKGYVKGNIELLTIWANNAKHSWGEDIWNHMITESFQRIQNPQAV